MKKNSLLNLSTPILWADLNMRYVAAALLAAQAGEDINEKVIEKILRWPKGGGRSADRHNAYRSRSPVGGFRKETVEQSWFFLLDG